MGHSLVSVTERYADRGKLAAPALAPDGWYGASERSCVDFNVLTSTLSTFVSALAAGHARVQSAGRGLLRA
jgi:hypothetical protein